MKMGKSLRSKVLLLALLNAALLAGALIWFARTQLTQDLGNLLLGEARGRLTAVALQLAKELPLTSLKDQNDLLARYSSAHGVTFCLFDNNGMQTAGPQISPPDTVVKYMKLLKDKSPLASLEAWTRGPDVQKSLMGSPDVTNILLVVEEEPFFTRGDPGYWVIFRMPLRSTDHPVFQPGVLTMVSPGFFNTPFFFDSKPWLAICGVLLLIGLACWLPLVRGATQSIASLVAATGLIAKGKFGAKVEIRRADELGQLGDSFNRMAGQLEGYMHGQKRFLRDAAHELRSPLARMQAALGNILEGEIGPEQEQFLEDLREEIDLMSSLTGELLTFAREENQHDRLKLAPVKLSETVARVVMTENPGGDADLRVQVDPGLIVTAHAESLFRGLSNVVRNAIRYAGDAGPITLYAERHDDTTIVTVTDKGPGIPDESLEMVFVPFYRLDISRNRQTGGNGLGMSIARSCVETCKGTIYCRNVNPGLQVTITLQAL